MALVSRKLFAGFALPSSVRQRLQNLYDKWAAIKLDKKVTVQEFVTFIQDALLEAMGFVNDLTDDATKKAVVMEFANELFDLFLPFIKQTLLGWILAFFGEDLLRQRFLDAVNLAIEMLYRDYFAPRPTLPGFAPQGMRLD